MIIPFFHHSPVFRISGDEFLVVLQNDDFLSRIELTGLFRRTGDEIYASAITIRDMAHAAKGITECSSVYDSSVYDTVKRADKLIYEKSTGEKGRF